MDKLLALYPQNVTQGSPYDTGTQNTLTPEFKRIASILGDYEFQAPRRFFLNSVSGKQNTWSFCTLHAPTHAASCHFHSYVNSHSKQAPEVGAHTWLVSLL